MTNIVHHGIPVPTVTTNFTTVSGDVQNMAAINTPFNNAIWSPSFGVDADGGTLVTGAASGNLDMWIKWDYTSSGFPVSIGLLNARLTYNGPMGSFQLQGSQDGTKWRNVGEVFTFDQWPNQTNGVKQIPLPPNRIPGNGYGYYMTDGFVDTFWFMQWRIIGVSAHIDAFPWPSVGGPQFTCFKPCYSGYAFPDGPEGWHSSFDFVVMFDSSDDPAYPYDYWVPPSSDADYIDPDTGTLPEPPDVQSPEVATLDGLPGNTYGGIWGWADRSSGGRASVSLSLHSSTTMDNQDADHDNNYGAAAGNGVFVNGSVSPGDYLQWTFDKPVQVFTMKFFGSGGPYGSWQLCSVADNGDNVPMGAEHTWVYDSDGVFEIEAKYTAPIWPVVRLVRRDGPNYLGARWWSESQFRIVSSPVEKGNRGTTTPGDQSPTGRVHITASFAPRDRGTHPVPDPTDELIWDALVDGIIATSNGGPFDAIPSVSFGGSGGLVVGDWLQFTFPRAVLLHEISPVMAFDYAESSATLPNKWGRWKIQRSVDNVTFTDIGDPFLFPIGNAAPRFPVPDEGQDGVPASYWRMVVAEGTPLEGSILSEVEFSVTDIGDPTPFPFGAPFQDEDGFSATPTLTEDTRAPFSGVFTDDTVFMATPTLKPNLSLTANFTDDGGFDVYSELGPSMVVQMNLVATGR